MLKTPLVLFSGKTAVLHHPDAEKSYRLIDGALPARSHADDVAHTPVVGVLGQGSVQSRLFKAVRQEQRAAYGFFADKFDFTR